MVSKQPPLGVGNPQCIDNWCLAGEDVQSAIANRPDPEGAPTNLPHGYRNARSGSAPLRPACRCGIYQEKGVFHV